MRRRARTLVCTALLSWAGQSFAAEPASLIGERRARAEWAKAENRRHCAPLALAKPGTPEGTPRRAAFGGGWAVAFDLPGLRSAYGFAGPGLLPSDAAPPSAQQRRLSGQWPYFRKLPHLPAPSFAGYGQEGASAYPPENPEGRGLHSLAYVRIGGQRCTYNVWSRISRAHLEWLPRQSTPALPLNACLWHKRPMDLPQRKIIHIDMDAFYASVEQRDDPTLRGKPIAVGGGGPRGVVATASYEARRFGVRSAMPGARARRLCPDLLFVRPRFEVYRAVSAHVRAIFARFTDIIQPLSLDEAYLDVTVNKPGIASATRIAEEIRRLIRQETGLTASAGVSYNKLIAKLASDQNKPDGICVVPPEEGPAFIAAMPVRRIHGVGPVTARRMQALGIETGADLRARDLAFLQHHFGSSAHFYYRAARGEDDRAVHERQERKSVSVEDTFFDDLIHEDALMAEIDRIAASLWERIEKSGAYGRTVTLKIKFADFRIITRSKSFAAPVRSPLLLAETGRTLLRAQLPLRMGARLLGLGIHNLDHDETQGEASEQLSLSL